MGSRQPEKGHVAQWSGRILLEKLRHLDSCASIVLILKSREPADKDRILIQFGGMGGKRETHQHNERQDKPYT